MDLYIATLIIQDAQHAAQKAAARHAHPSLSRHGLLSFFGSKRTR